MRTLVTADLHLNANPRDNYRWAVWQQIRRHMNKHGAERLLLLGDLTDEKDHHSGELVNMIFDHLYSLSQDFQVIVLRGNHDGVDPNLPFFTFMGQLQNVMWINKPKADNMVGMGLCVFLPHTRNHERDWQLSWAPFERDPKCGWIFAHNTFDGAEAEGGRKLRGIQTTVFPRNCRVIAGDVHVPQKVDVVRYVGAPYTIDFGDKYEPRMFLIEGKNLKSIDNPGAQKRLVEVKAGDFRSPKNVQPGDLLKIKVELTPEHVADWKQIQADYRTWGEDHDCTVCSVVPVKPLKKLKLGKTEKKHVEDDELMRQFVKRNQAGDDVLKTGLWLKDQV